MDSDEAANRRTSARLQGRSHPKTYKTDEEDEIKEIPVKRRAVSKQREKSTDLVGKSNSEIILSDGSDLEDLNDDGESINDEEEERPDSTNEQDCKIKFS